jgi:hypothetical protein
MNDISNQPPALLSMEEGVAVLWNNARLGLRHRLEKCEARIRKSPMTSVLGAAAAGYLLHRMPVRAILVTQVRVLSALTPPALFLFGAAKLYEFLQKQEVD